MRRCPLHLYFTICVYVNLLCMYVCIVVWGEPVEEWGVDNTSSSNTVWNDSYDSCFAIILLLIIFSYFCRVCSHNSFV